MILLNSAELKKRNAGFIKHIRIYEGSDKENLTTTSVTSLYSKDVPALATRWKNSAAREAWLTLRRSLEGRVREMNAATGFDMETIRALAGNYTIDLVRLADDYADYTPVIFKETFDEALPEMFDLRDQLPYVGKEENIIGSSDTVPLMEHKLPVEYPVRLFIRGFGDKSTLRELVFNPFHKTEKTLESAARILADEKNADSIKPIVTATYDSYHTQEADTSGATFDLQLYNTIRKGVIKALGLINKGAGKANGTMHFQVYLLINPLDQMNIIPVINGALASAGGIQQIAGKLPIDGVISYGNGLNDGQKYGSETLKYPGCDRGYAYAIIVPEVYSGYRFVKQNETMEVGEGDILGLTTEKRAWHRIRGIHNLFVLPDTTGSGQSAKCYGSVIKIELPTM
jgi:hypothetical protein